MNKSVVFHLKRSLSIDPRKILKLLSVFGYILYICILIILIKYSLVSSYEFSLYDAYPIYFWAMIIVCLSIGQITMLGHSYFSEVKKDWLDGFILVILVNTILLVLPLTRYFTFGRGDVLTHIGYMIDIKNMFSIGSNHYPATHLLGTIISYYSEIDFYNIVMIIPPIFSIFSIFSWYLVGKEIFNSKRELILMLTLTSVLSFGILNTLTTPFHQSTLLIPFVLYLFIRSNSGNRQIDFKILLIIFCILLVFYHPLTLIILLLIFLTMKFTSVYYKMKFQVEQKVNVKNITLIIFVLYCIWGSYLEVFVNNLNSFIGSIFGYDEQTSQLSSYVETINYADVGLNELFKIVTFTYGNKVILAIISAVCVVLLFNKLFINKNTNINYFHIFSTTGFIIFSVFSILLLVLQSSFGFMRVFHYTSFFSFVLVSFSLADVIYNNSLMLKKRIYYSMIVILCLSLILFSTISVLNLYESPLVKKTNGQVTKGEFNGVASFFKTRNTTYQTLEYGISHYRFHNGIYGSDYPAKLITLRDTLPISHFNYTNSNSVSSSYTAPHYFLLSNNRGLRYYPTLFPEYENKWRFNSSDFLKLDTDRAVYKFYDNKELSIFIFCP